jgi:TPR repeat protein
MRPGSECPLAFFIFPEAGSAEAQNSIGDLYYEGAPGINKDLEESVKWYRMAAEQGHVGK